MKIIVVYLQISIAVRITVSCSDDETRRPVMKENMKYIAENAEAIDKVSEVEARISQVKTVAWDNIHKVQK